MIEGIGHGIWWAVVTKATAGYGDKAPKTIGGRIIALGWIIFSIVFIASFTANITTSLTLESLKGKVRCGALMISTMRGLDHEVAAQCRSEPGQMDFLRDHQK